MKKSFKGMATPTAVIFTMVSMFITAGYLKYAMSASVMQAGGVEGMQTLDQDLQRLVSQGKIKRSAAAQIAENPKLFGSNVL